MPADRNESSSLEYLASGRVDLAYPLDGAQFRPDYAYVLTRMPGVATGRSLIARDGGVALQRRIRPVDVLADFGLIVARPQDDRGGYAYVDPYVDEPMQFVAGGRASRTVFLALGFRLASTAAVEVTGRSVVRSSRSGRELSLCLRTYGGPSLATARLRLSPRGDIQLTRMQAAGSCTSGKQSTIPRR